MYTTHKNMQILVSLLKQYDVRDVVISPGSRNMALVRSFEGDPFFRTYSVVDERSAAYFAIGVWLETGRPVALSSTSAQATRNYIPGMTEAFYRGAPLVFITSDFRPSVIGQGMMQAIDQLSIPKDSAKYSTGLPMIKDDADYRHCVRLVNEALLELDHHGTGPVHMNIPVEEHYAGEVAVLPTAPKINRHMKSDAFPKIGDKKVLVVIGQHHAFSDTLKKTLEDFASKYHAVFFTNHLSNYRGAKSVNASLLLEGSHYKSFKDIVPDIVITIGGQHGDYPLTKFLDNIGQFEHWRVNEDGAIRDTYGKLTDVFEMSEQDFFDAYNEAKKTSSGDSYYNSWSKLVDKRVTPSQLPLSHAYVASQLVQKIPANSVMHFGILSSLRNWNYFRNDVNFIGYSNVAAFGIDGCLSTYIGQSIATDRLSFMIIGDLSFFYDMNALGIRQIKNNARVVLVNNSGGGEFRLYTHPASTLGDEVDKHIVAAGHHGTAKAWAESMGWEYICAHTKEEFDELIPTIVGESDKPVFTEVFTTMQGDSDGVKQMIKNNTSQSLKSKVKESVSPATKHKIKKVLKR